MISTTYATRIIGCFVCVCTYMSLRFWVGMSGPILAADEPQRKTNLYTRKRRHAIRYPKSFDPSRTIMTVPDPHRWLPRSQRPGQSRRRNNPASYIRGPQGLVSSEERKSAGPSTAHIELGPAPSRKKKTTKK